jgi:hypothetical protein
VISPDAIDAAIRIVRAEEAWEPVLFGGMIPILGALAVVYLIWHAVKENPENDPPPDEQNPPAGGADDEHEGPLS